MRFNNTKQVQQHQHTKTNYYTISFEVFVLARGKVWHCNKLVILLALLYWNDEFAVGTLLD